jgi:RNA polymerase sigma-70 factor (ECF subfamily)
MHRDFANVLQNFSPEQRMVLHLHLQREFTQSEIVKIMDCPLGTVKSHVQRGRLKLQQYMEAWKI